MRRSAYAVLATTALAFTAFTAGSSPRSSRQPLIQAVQRGECQPATSSIDASGRDTAIGLATGTMAVPTAAIIAGAAVQRQLA